MSPINRFPSHVCLALVLVVALGAQAGAQNSTPRFRQTVTVPGVTPLAPGSEYAVWFSGPFGLPGVGLSGGTYVFRVPTSNVIQVLSGDRAHVYAMVMTIPTTRKVTERDVVFGEGLAYAPRPIAAWFPPGSKFGHQLLYPKKAAAKASVGPSN